MPHVYSFATVGMFSAISNLGAGGLSNVALSDTANGVLYGCFAVIGLVSGGICNREFFSHGLSHLIDSSHNPCDSFAVIGPRLTLFIGSLGYALYVGSLWWYV